MRTGVVIQCRACMRCESHFQSVEMLQQPSLLLWHTHAHKQNIRSPGIDRTYHSRRIGTVAVVQLYAQRGKSRTYEGAALIDDRFT